MNFPDPFSVVDYLKTQNQASDFDSRTSLAGKYGIQNYTGTADQNTQLLGLLRGQTGNTDQTRSALSSSSNAGGFSSSAQPNLNNATQQGMSSATSSLLGGNQNNQNQPPPQDMMSMVRDLMNQNKDSFMSGQQQDKSLGEQILQSRYDSGLASVDQQYNNAFQDLTQQHQKATGIVKTQAAQLNPYSGPDSSQTNYQGKIDSEFQKQADRLTQTANAARQALQNGDVEAHLQLQMQQGQQQQAFQQNMNNLLLGLSQESERQKEFGISQSNVWADNFTNQLQKINYTPEQVDQLVENHQIYNDPTFQAGMKAGFDPSGIITAMKSGSMASQNLLLAQQKAADQTSLGWARIASAQENAAMRIANMGTLVQGTGPTGEPIVFNNRTMAWGPAPWAATPGAGAGAAALPDQVTSAITPALLSIKNKFGYKPADAQAGYQAVQSALASGDIKNVQREVANYVYKGLSTSAKASIDAGQSIVDHFNILKQDLATAKAKGVNTGFINGNWEKAMQMLGNTSSPELAKIRSEMETIKFNYITMASGKQFSDKERAAYGVIVPDVTNNDTLNYARIEGVSKIFNSNLQSSIKNTIGQSNYNSIYGSAATQPASSINSVLSPETLKLLQSNGVTF